MVTGTVTGAPQGFGPAVLSGLAELGPVDPASGDLSLELGVSAWMRSHATTLDDARDLLLDLRHHILEAAGLDEATEPLPFVGRSPRLDVIMLISYVAGLLRRGATASGCSVTTLARRVSAALPEPEAAAIGA
jgi:hypothetical protein